MQDIILKQGPLLLDAMFAKGMCGRGYDYYLMHATDTDPTYRYGYIADLGRVDVVVDIKGKVIDVPREYIYWLILKIIHPLSASDIYRVRHRLRDANLCHADLSGVDLRSVDLYRAMINGADLRNADLRGADLRDACLCYTRLSHTRVDYADLSRASLQAARIDNVDFSTACTRDVDLYYAEINNVRGL